MTHWQIRIMIKIQSGNLEIILCNLESLKMIAEDKSKLAKKLKIKIPDVWPVSPEAIPIFQKILQPDETMVGWLNYFVIHREDKTLIGDCGFLGRPDKNKTVEVGYSIIPGYRRRGYTKEMVGTLIEWAFSTKEVQRIIAHTIKENTPSIKVLEHLGFTLMKDNIKTGEGIKYLWELKSGT